MYPQYFFYDVKIETKILPTTTVQPAKPAWPCKPQTQLLTFAPAPAPAPLPMSTTTVTPALLHERSTATFNVRELTYYLYSTKANVLLKERMELLIEQDPIFDKTLHYNSSRPVKYARAMQKQRRIIEMTRTMQLNKTEARALRTAVHDNLGTDLQNLMFIPNIRSTFSTEQAALFLPQAESWKIIGAYAQTEMGHGSNVRALETTATFDATTDELIVHSPTKSATKWWPGALGRTANYAVVYARLIVHARDLGIHNILVPIRDLETHIPLPGITVGDIGAKIGYNNQDNGFCRFDSVRVPRTHLGMKHATLTKEGTYTSSATRKKASYSSMTSVRAVIVRTAGDANARAATIGVRYSAVRKQGYSKDGTTENYVLDYTMQQARLFPTLAASFAFQATGGYMLKLVQANDIGSLHIASSGLKALCSKITCANIEACRKCCGGHGYLMSSGLPDLLGTYKQNATVEGENFMIAQQTTKQLLKMLNGVSESTGDSTDYIHTALSIANNSTCKATAVEDFFDCNVQMEAYKQRAAYLLLYLDAKLQKAEKDGVHEKEAWNLLCPDVIRVSEAHCFYILIRNFAITLDALKPTNVELYNVLCDQRDLFALWWMQERMGEFFESGYLTSTVQAEWIRRGVGNCLKKIRPNAVALVDAWGHTDFCLNSTLGRYDGQYIDALWESAQGNVNPMNNDVVDPVFLESIKGMRGAGVESRL